MKSTPQHLATGVPARSQDLLLERRYRLVCSELPSTGAVLLDFGCGNGAQTVFFAPHFDRVIGLDINTEFLAELESTWQERQLGAELVPLLYGGAEFPLPDASVDCIVSFEVLEHVADEQLALRELRRVLKPGGTLIISVPNRWWIFETHGAQLPLLPWNRVPFFSWLPRRLHDRWAHARNYRRSELRNLLRAADLEIRVEFYVTAPMDVVRWRPLQRLLRRLVFRGDRTSCPMLATSCLAVAKLPAQL